MPLHLLAEADALSAVRDGRMSSTRARPPHLPWGRWSCDVLWTNDGPAVWKSFACQASNGQQFGHNHRSAQEVADASLTYARCSALKRVSDEIAPARCHVSWNARLLYEHDR